ncbi:nuclear transport factor 2 family protein [Aureispira anguillae]|uniref:Nuclear transport factor 2 family protein n=1 Tax=Aureispira anguillae TaxID=2864201 RepID=A0A915YMH1_9BACT|nr:nuclear transport factor 2 family protein [Aureispira anguillae]BDS15528.1 nuclear transport factor 2 family protein [Aureispira anguillae]
MKNLLLGSILCFAISVDSAVANTNPIKAIVEAVENFASNADQQNVAKMEKTLHKDFRAVLNQLFGSKEVSITNKESYLELLKAKKIGGDTRIVTINSVDIQGKNAFVKATFKGKKLNFNTYLLLVEEEKGLWKIISDTPLITTVE